MKIFDNIREERDCKRTIKDDKLLQKLGYFQNLSVFTTEDPDVNNRRKGVIDWEGNIVVPANYRHIQILWRTNNITKKREPIIWVLNEDYMQGIITADLKEPKKFAHTVGLFGPGSVNDASILAFISACIKGIVDDNIYDDQRISTVQPEEVSRKLKKELKDT